MNISVMGLGKLGLPMALYFASKHHKVIGVDLNNKLLNDLYNLKCPVDEPGVNDLLKNNQIELTDDSYKAIGNSKISFIFVGTPNLGDGAFSVKYVHEVGKSIGKALKYTRGYHLVVLRSTVLPGETENLKHILEKYSGKKCGKEFGLCHSPEFLALGKVINDISNPEFILIGENDKESGDILEDFYKSVTENDAPVIRTNLVNAEIGKLMLNNYVTLKMDYANMMAEMCEKIKGAHVDEVSNILGHDSRIGRKFLTGGMAYGGTCFPRDNKALIYYMDQIGMSLNLPNVIEKMNNNQTDRLYDFIEERVGKIWNKKIIILGKTFKPDTNVVEESASIKIAEMLDKFGANVLIHDPTDFKQLPKIKDYDIAILATPWKIYKKLTKKDFKGVTLIDCWRFYNPNICKDYHAIGIYKGGKK